MIQSVYIMSKKIALRRNPKPIFYEQEKNALKATLITILLYHIFAHLHIDKYHAWF